MKKLTQMERCTHKARFKAGYKANRNVPDKCVIKWDEKRAAFDPVYWWEGYNHDLKDYEVIGNIFDNPDYCK